MPQMLYIKSYYTDINKKFPCYFSHNLYIVYKKCLHHINFLSFYASSMDSLCFVHLTYISKINKYVDDVHLEKRLKTMFDLINIDHLITANLPEVY